MAHPMFGIGMIGFQTFGASYKWVILCLVMAWLGFPLLVHPINAPNTNGSSYEQLIIYFYVACGLPIFVYGMIGASYVCSWYIWFWYICTMYILWMVILVSVFPMIVFIWTCLPIISCSYIHVFLCKGVAPDSEINEKSCFNMGITETFRNSSSRSERLLKKCLGLFAIIVCQC